jgi:hypothetical protein
VPRKSFLGWVIDLLFVCMKPFYIFMNDQICDTIIKYLFIYLFIKLNLEKCYFDVYYMITFFMKYFSKSSFAIFMV